MRSPSSSTRPVAPLATSFTRSGTGGAAIVAVPQANPLGDARERACVLEGKPLPEALALRVRDLLPLRAIAAAEFLNLSGTGITAIEGISHLSGVRRISFANTAVASLDGLCGTQFLEEIDVSQTAITDLSLLAQAPMLRVVRADYSAVRVLGALLLNPSLKEIYLRRSAVDIAALVVPRRDLLVFVD